MEKKPWYSSSLLIILLACSLTVAGQVRPADFRHLDKLEGTWVMRTKLSLIVEQWRKVNDSTFQGRAWRITGRDSSLQETIQLVRRADGIYYIPTVSDQNNGQPVPFKLRVLKPVGFVAENPQHDFPQKITYRWRDARHLDARVEGKEGKTTAELIFQYEKQP
ncbi:DUF6265 family protein [Chitinophaga japonensis]|uniref:DUF6265 domain-containing protein n=1 Tax=Chitinophaga japonensis TaxID=104662 RepID=A0A562SMX9_CHIJA|nr:DUF6265 family protein [Chitinophaga japonensis]TWI82647.1 hypothetical protein LX66_5224 [Chitinophaga japonensis]